MELILAEKLFNLELSVYPKLVEVEEDLKKMAEIFDFYSSFKNKNKQWSKVLWQKLDYQKLEEGRKTFHSGIKKLNQKYGALVVFQKVRDVVENFNKILPLIEKLKNNTYFKQQHWKKLIGETGIVLDNVDFSQITLQEVFNMNLQNYPDKVDEIVNMAMHESNNEGEINKIEQFWKNANLEVIDYKKGNEKSGVVIKLSEDIKTALDDHLTTLQNIESSKYVTTLKPLIQEWMKILIQI